MELVNSPDELKSNLLKFEEFRHSNNVDERNFYKELIKISYRFLAYKFENKIKFAPSKFIGYKNNNLTHKENRNKKDAGNTTRKISALLNSEHCENLELDREFRWFCTHLGISPNQRKNRYWDLTKDSFFNFKNVQAKENSIFVSPPEISKRKKEKDFIKQNHFFNIENELRNKSLGEKGEEFVLKKEKERLENLGRKDLANKIKWISKEKGDGEGYDILSYDEKGNEIFIEVKTTNMGKNTSFFITSHELEFCKIKKEQYYIYRVFNFADLQKRQIFRLKGPLDDIEFVPKLYLAKIY